MCLELLISISFRILLCVLVFMFFQPRSFYFYRACVCVFVPGFHHPAGHLWSLAWIPCCSVCRSVFPVGLPLPGKADGSTSVRMAGSEEAPFGVQTSASAALVFLGQFIQTLSRNIPKLTVPFLSLLIIICIFCVPDIGGNLSST